MKTIIAAMLLSTMAFANTQVGITPVLHFDKNVKIKKSLIKEKLIVKIEKKYFDVKTSKSKRYWVKKRRDIAFSVLSEIVNSKEFKTMVISYERDVKVGKYTIKSRSYAKNYLWKNSSQNLTNEQIYDVLMRGDEKMRVNTLGEMNINSRINRKLGPNTIGATSPATSAFMTMNWAFYKNFNSYEMASNVVHEWTHLLGFLHGENSTKHQEVPYVVGAIVKELARKIIKENIHLTPL